MNLLASMFWLGVLTLTAQFVFVRELLLTGAGNELTIGLVITVWLALTGLGAMAGRFWAGRAGRDGWQRWAPRLMAALGCLVPMVVLGLRLGAGALNAGTGEYAPLPRLLAVAVIALFPVCTSAAALFPVTCAVREGAGMGGGRGIGAVYAAEACGGFVAGCVCTFILAGRAGPFQIAMGAAVAGWMAAAMAVQGRTGRRGLMAVAVLLLAAAVCPWPWLEVDARSLNWRLGRQAGSGVRLAGWMDTRYQHLELAESAGQYTVYADGHVAFSFPDVYQYEHTLHMVMAQKPRARRVLLIGGNPEGDIPVLLTYPLERLDRVELDAGLDALVREARVGALRMGEHDRRLRTFHMDGVRFVRESTNRYDVVLVRVPEPVTGGINRFYTREFYADVRQRLAAGGFMYASVEGSERLEQEARRAAGSVYKALKEVFPHILVTAGTPVQFFAASGSGDVTFDVAELERRWRAVAPECRHFRPEYFRTAGEFEPERVRQVRARLEAADVGANSMEHPLSYFQMLVMWSRYSGSGIERVLKTVGGWRVDTVCWGVGAVVLAWICAGWVVGRCGRSWVMGTTGIVMAGTGFTGIALELVLLYAFQAVEGYVYSQMGVLVGLFMLGAVTGSLLGRWQAGAEAVFWRVALGLCGLGSIAAWVWWHGVASLSGTAITMMTGLAGMAVGWGVVAVSDLLCRCGMATGKVASMVNTFDYAGACLGGLATVVVLVPVLGLREACQVLVCMQAGCLMLLACVQKGLSRRCLTMTA